MVTYHGSHKTRMVYEYSQPRMFIECCVCGEKSSTPRGEHWLRQPCFPVYGFDLLKFIEIMVEKNNQ